MNIFVLDLDPRRCASYHCDFHVGKMITETAQILSTVLGGPYKPTHVSHPCVKWAEDGIDNVAWLLALGDALGNEFMYRRGKLHASSLVLNELQRRFAPMLVNIQPPTHFALAMPSPCPSTFEEAHSWRHRRKPSSVIERTTMPASRGFGVARGSGCPLHGRSAKYQSGLKSNGHAER